MRYCAFPCSEDTSYEIIEELQQMVWFINSNLKEIGVSIKMFGGYIWLTWLCLLDVLHQVQAHMWGYCIQLYTLQPGHQMLWKEMLLHMLQKHTSQYVFKYPELRAETAVTRQSLKGSDMSWHDLVSAWNHAEDMVAVSPLTTNVCITCHETFGFKYYHSYVSTICEVTSSNVLGRNGGTWGGGLVHSKGEIAWPCLGLAAKMSGWAIFFLSYFKCNFFSPVLSANGPRKLSSYCVGLSAKQCSRPI